MRGDQQFRLHADLMRTNVPDGADVELSRARDRGGAPPRLTDVHRLGSRNVGAITNRVHVTADQNSFIPLIDQSHFDADFCQLPFRPMIDVSTSNPVRIVSAYCHRLMRRNCAKQAGRN